MLSIQEEVKAISILEHLKHISQYDSVEYRKLVNESEQYYKQSTAEEGKVLDELFTINYYNNFYLPLWYIFVTNKPIKNLRKSLNEIFREKTVGTFWYTNSDNYEVLSEVKFAFSQYFKGDEQLKRIAKSRAMFMKIFNPTLKIENEEVPDTICKVAGEQYTELTVYLNFMKLHDASKRSDNVLLNLIKEDFKEKKTGNVQDIKILETMRAELKLELEELNKQEALNVGGN